MNEKYKEILNERDAINENGDVVYRDDIENYEGQLEFDIDIDTHYSTSLNQNKNNLPPIAVELGARAIALEQATKRFNQESKLGGLAMIREMNPNQFDQRYKGKANDVFKGALTKLDGLRIDSDEAVSVLTASDAMRAHGYSEQDIQMHESRLRRALSNDLGPGSSNAKERAKAVSKAKKAAKRK